MAAGAVSVPKGAFLRHLTQSPKLPHGSQHERFPRHLRHLPRDYELAIRWLRPSFLIRDHWTPGRKGRDIHGLATLRYLDQGNPPPVIGFDVLFRLLRHRYGADHVIYVRNITDVDDKINDRAARDFPGLPLNEAIRKVPEGTD